MEASVGERLRMARIKKKEGKRNEERNENGREEIRREMKGEREARGKGIEARVAEKGLGRRGN